MALGILPSNLIGQVTSGKVLGILSSGMIGEVDPASAHVLGILPSGLIGEVAGSIARPTVGASVSKGGTGYSTAITTQTSGSSFLIIVGEYQQSVAAAPTDNKGNTYTLVKAFDNAGDDYKAALWACINATGGAGHQFQNNNTNGYGTMSVLEVKGAISAGANTGLNHQSGASYPTGSITPHDSDLVISALVYDYSDGGTPKATISSGWTIQEDSYPVDISSAIATKNDATSASTSATWASSKGVNGQAFILALNATTFPLTLTGTLPDAVKGSTYNGVLTLGGDYTGAVTASASVGSFPTWATVTVDESAGTVTFSGTPDTVETESFTVEVTDSTSPTPQTATSAQSITVSVQPAATIPTLVNQKSNKGTGASWSVDTPTGMGGILFLAIGWDSKGSLPAGWTEVHTTTDAWGADGQFMTLAYKVADGSEGSTIGAAAGSAPGAGWSVVCNRYAGVSLDNAIAVSSFSATDYLSSGTISTHSDTLNIPVDDCKIIYVCAADSVSGNAVTEYTAPTGYANGIAAGEAGQSSIYVAEASIDAGPMSDPVEGTFKCASASWAVALVVLTPISAAAQLLGTLSNGLVGQDYSSQFRVVGNYVTPVTVDASVGTIPSWLDASLVDGELVFSADAGDVVSGTYTFTPRMTDADSTVTTASAQTLEFAAAGSTFFAKFLDPGKTGMIISNNGKTVAFDGSALGGTIAEADMKEASTANVYMEVHVEKLTAFGSSVGFGKINYTSDNSAGPGENTSSPVNSAGFGADGYFATNGVDVKQDFTWGAGDILKVALKNGKMYRGKVGHGWEDSSDPDTETNPVYSGMSGDWGPAAGTDFQGQYKFTFNFGQYPFKDTPPSGSDTWTTTATALGISGTLPNASVGVAYSGMLAVTGDYHLPLFVDASSGSFPSWSTVTVNDDTITVSGTPTATETDTFTVRVSDSSSSPRTATSPQTITVGEDVTYATWDPASTKYGTALSNGNLTLSCGDSNGGLAAVSDAGVAVASMHHYYECSIDDLKTGAKIDIGFAKSDWSSGAPPGNDYNDPAKAFGIENDGTMKAGQSTVGNTGVTFAKGDKMKLYVATGGKVYVGKVGSAWPTGHDPENSGDTPQYTLPSGTWRPAAGGYGSSTTAVVLTANFGKTAFTDTPPAGAVGWTT